MWDSLGKEYWSELPCPPPGDLLDPGIEPMSLMSPLLAVGSLPQVPPGKPVYSIYVYMYNVHYTHIQHKHK